MVTPGNTKGGSITVDLLFDWFGISCMTTDNFCFYFQNGLIQTCQTGGQGYSDTSPFSIPWLHSPTWVTYMTLSVVQQSEAIINTDTVEHKWHAECSIGTARFLKCKQWFKYQDLLLLRDIGWSKLSSIFKCCLCLQHQS